MLCLFMTPWTLACQAPLSLRVLQARILEWFAMFSLQGNFPNQGKNPGLPHCRWILYHLSHQGSPRILEWAAYPFSRGISQLRNWTGASCIAGRVFTSWATRKLHVKHSVGQKVGLGFCITSFRKSKPTFLPTQYCLIHLHVTPSIPSTQ